MKKDTAKAICTQHPQASCPNILKDILAKARLGMKQEHCRNEGLTSFMVLNELCFQPSSCIARKLCSHRLPINNACTCQSFMTFPALFEMMKVSANLHEKAAMEEGI